MPELDLGPEPGWLAVPPHPTRGGHSFVSGDSTGERLRVAYYREGAEGSLVARAWFGPLCEGPPGHAHGGSQAALLDETVGGNAWLQGYPVLAGTLTVHYFEPLPLGSIVTVRSWITEVDGRKIMCGGRIEGADGRVFSDAEAVFIVMRDEVREKLAEVIRAQGGSTRGMI